MINSNKYGIPSYTASACDVNTNFQAYLISGN